MNSLKTNRDLYLAIDELISRNKSGERSLEQYLLAMLNLAQKYKSRSSLSVTEFYQILSDSFTVPPSAFVETWRSDYDKYYAELDGYPQWEGTIIQQIVDLREMAENGLLENEYRYLGITSPRETSWYNFDPAAYLECATAGSLGGWEPDDDTGRHLIGERMMMASSEEVHFADSQDIELSRFEIAVISWEIFEQFITCGRVYE